MTAAHETLSALLGPAALGLLTSVEQRQLDQHLQDCKQCRSEFAGLAGVVRRLGDLDPAHVLLDDLQPDPDRAAAIVSAVAREHVRRQTRVQRWQAVLATAASVAVLAAGLTSAAALSRDDGPAVPLEAVAVQTPAGIEASADLVPHTWGVEIKLAATGLAAGQPYTVEVRTRDGRLVSAGAFLGTGDRTLFCNLNAAVLRPDAASFVVRNADGAEILAADL